MSFQNILLLVLLVIVLYYLLTTFLTPTEKKMHDAREEIRISGEDVSSLNLDRAYSIWTYIDNWNYRYGEEKIIWTQDTLALKLDAFKNNLTLNIPYRDELDKVSTFTCNIPNVPLQKWVNIIVSTNGKAVDVYINGKLAKTCLMQYVPYTASDKELVITEGGGFSGHTARFEFFSNPVTPAKAWSIYSKGSGQDSGFASFMSKYQVKVAILESGEEGSSFVF